MTDFWLKDIVPVLFWLLICAIVISRRLLQRKERQRPAATSPLQEWLVRRQESEAAKSDLPATEAFSPQKLPGSAPQDVPEPAPLQQSTASRLPQPPAVQPPSRAAAAAPPLLRKRTRPADWREGIVLATVFGPPRGEVPYESPRH